MLDNPASNTDANPRSGGVYSATTDIVDRLAMSLGVEPADLLARPGKAKAIEPLRASVSQDRHQPNIGQAEICMSISAWARPP